MAETQPFPLQALCYTFGELREGLAAHVCGEGVVDVHGGDLLVASTGAGDHSVTIAAGSAFVFNNDATGERQMYRVLNDASVTVQLSAGGGGNPRVDTIVATVQDDEYGGGSNDWVLVSVDGTPNASAALTDAGIAASAAAVPDNSVVLAYVLVPDADTLSTIISGANILDARNNYYKCGSDPWCSLEAAAATSITNGNYVQLALATLVYRDRDYFSVSGSTITVLQSGLYRLNAQGWFSNGSANIIGAAILKNNTNLPNATPDGLFVAENNVGGLRGYLPVGRSKIALAANDTIKFAMTVAGVTTNTIHTAGSRVAHLTIEKVG